MNYSLLAQFAVFFLACFLAIWVSEVLKNLGIYFAQLNQPNQQKSSDDSSAVVQPYEIIACIILWGPFFSGFAKEALDSRK